MSKNDCSKEKVTLRETFRATKRGYKLLSRYNPGLFTAMTLSSLAEVLTPYVLIYFSARIIDELAGARDPGRLTFLVILTLAAELAVGVLRAALTHWKNAKNGTMWIKKDKLFVDKYLDMDFCDVDSQRVHDLRSQVQQNENWSSWGLATLVYWYEEFIGSVWRVIGAVALSVTLFTNTVPESGGGLTVLNNPLFIALVLAVMLGLTFIAPVLSNKADAIWASHAGDATMGNRFFGFFGFMMFNRERAGDIRIYRQDKVCRSYSGKRGAFSLGGTFAKLCKGRTGLLNAGSAAIANVFTGAAYVFVCLKAYGGAFGIGMVTQYVGALTNLADGLGKLIGSVGRFRNNTVFLRTVYELLDIPNAMYQGELTTEKRSDRKYTIEFRDVSFKYPGTEQWALRHVTFKFTVGERLAVVGRNGSGKTTFIKLLCRLYDPTEGEIRLNGIDIRKYDYDQYMDIFSVVFQDFNLLAFSLGQNVAASAKVDRAKAEECLKEAGFGERLGTLGRGLDTNIYKEFDDKGVEISGGESQKIAIARALYKDSAFIILDEPTASLDPVAEADIYTKFDKMVGDKTAIYISHRLSSCRFCDKIAVFENGAVAESGTHDSLLASGGKYSELWHAQAQYYDKRQSEI